MGWMTGVALGILFAAALGLPAWWMAGRVGRPDSRPAFRFMLAVGLALAGYIGFVGAVGRLSESSTPVAWVWLVFNLVAAYHLRRKFPLECSLASLPRTWRDWMGPLVLALLFAVPQWSYAVCTNSWDEAASSAIHLTAPNQFAEGVFPPRHNAFPDVVVKYHYAFTMLSGTVKWLTGLSANFSIDVASTLLWLFIFLFVFFWLEDLGLGRFASGWGSFAVLLGGGLSWLFLPRLEAYSGVLKLPPVQNLVQAYNPSRGWIWNLVELSQVHSLHLRNLDGTLSHLPWDVASHFQQHPVPVGIALTVLSACLFLEWRARPGLSPLLLFANVLSFGTLLLAHAVFGGTACLTAGLTLLLAWLRRPSWTAFLRGAVFTLGVTALALLLGGFFVSSADYGGESLLTLRGGFGYWTGGLSGFLLWHLAGFGLPLLLALAAVWFHFRHRSSTSPKLARHFSYFALFGLISYAIPQVCFYSSDTSGVEEFTEIAKFFFSAHLALAMLSALAIDRLAAKLPRLALIPVFALVAVTPLAICYRNSFGTGLKWNGFYISPYEFGGPTVQAEIGKAFRKLKQTPRDVYYDASNDENRTGYLNELLIYGGSVFTLTPSRYERTGVGYRLAADLVARRYRQNSRMARLLPGAAEDAAVSWFYVRPVEDMAFAPLIVRSRFDKAVADGVFVKKYQAGPRSLYRIEAATTALDDGIERHFRPRVVAQTRSDWDGDGRDDLIFFDFRAKKILIGQQTVDLPEWLSGPEYVQLYCAHFPGEKRVDFLLGRMTDTDFRLGKSIHEVIERDDYAWTYRDSNDGRWQPEYRHWLWDWDLPFVADIDGDGLQRHFAYRPRTGEWFTAPNRPLLGPAVAESELPVPLAGRFLEGSRGDLGLWSLRTGMLTLRSASDGRTVSFKWGGRPGDVLVPADYDGDGYDEIAVWQRSNLTWYWRKAPDGPISQATFGSVSGVPLPADYNHDGRVDLAYWEPAAGFIFVSFDQGRTIDLKIVTPPNSMPAFVNFF